MAGCGRLAGSAFPIELCLLHPDNVTSGRSDVVASGLMTSLPVCWRHVRSEGVTSGLMTSLPVFFSIGLQYASSEKQREKSLPFCWRYFRSADVTSGLLTSLPFFFSISLQYASSSPWRQREKHSSNLALKVAKPPFCLSAKKNDNFYRLTAVCVRTQTHAHIRTDTLSSIHFRIILIYYHYANT